jgi:hypothetical protein
MSDPRRQIVLNWVMGEEDLSAAGWWTTSDGIEKVDELLAALDAYQLHKSDSRQPIDFARRVRVEQRLLDAASGKQPLPDRDECRALAHILGVPDEYRDSAVSADEARYRWLRSENTATNPLYYPFWQEFMAKLCREDQMDALIDSAMTSRLVAQPHKPSGDVLKCCGERDSDGVCCNCPDPSVPSEDSHNG